MIDVRDEKILKIISQLIQQCGEASDTFVAQLVTQMIQSCLKLMLEKHDTGQLKLINRALKEMRHAYSIFNRYPDAQCISIFGSARTPEHHPDYQAAKQLSFAMAEIGWMCITGAADGIMKAGLEGTQKESSFGLSIRLPFEIPISTMMEGDDKLMMFRYFFTRKLMFISHAHAIAAFPGGVGTLDELFEVFTLMQTGKSKIVPLVLLEGTPGEYWKHWNSYIDSQLLSNGWISPEDKHLYYIASTPCDAREHILQFYKRYHSSRYVKELLVMRLQSPLSERELGLLNEEFFPLVEKGKMFLSGPLPEETDLLSLPRLIFHHNKQKFGMIRALIDRINQF